MKKIFSILVSITIIINAFMFPVQANYTPADEAYSLVNYLNNRVGESFPSNRCQAFVYQSVGNAIGVWASQACAYEAWLTWGVSSSKDIPLGATVYFSGSSVQCGNHKAGHVGIYVGDGYIVHAASSKVQKTQISYIESYWSGYEYLGWGWNGGYSLVTDDTEPPSFYTITYNANGGDGAPVSQTKLPGETIALSSAWPSRPGFAFWGWATSSDATVATYPAGGTYSADSNITLYAFWKPVDSTITYNANGGINAPSPQIKPHGETIKLSSQRPSRFGYTFWGWATSPNATTATYPSGSNYSKEGDITLYAFWKKAGYIITYNANGGVGAPDSQIRPYGETIQLSTEYPSRPGFVFWGWATSADATVATYPSGGTYSADSDITLYAFWLPVYEIVYDANGGVGAPASQTKTKGNSIQLSTIKPTRQGYTFGGWSENKNATIGTWAGGEIYPYDRNMNLYAVWLSVYEIVYDANGGVGAPASQTKTKGNSIQLSTIKPTRQGYTFGGWSENKNATIGTWAGGEIYPYDRNMYLYAVWRENKYIITFDSTGGVLDTKDIMITYNSAYGELPTPVREGYVFKGWFTSAEGGEEITSESIVTTASSHTLYAQWEKLEPYIESVVKKKGNTYEITASLYNISGDKTIIFAGYKEERLVDISYSDGLLDATLAGDIDEIKVMVWESLTGLKSLCDDDTVLSDEFIVE